MFGQGRAARYVRTGTGGLGGSGAGRAARDAEDVAATSAGLRWPWALLAAGVGAAAGAAVALVVRSQLQSDPPGAQEPHELRAVVDRPAPEPPA